VTGAEAPAPGWAAAPERVPTRVFPDAGPASVWVAREIAALVRERASLDRPCVLGLPTGATPIGVYAELVRLHREEGLSFAHVETFNLDEYYPIAPDELQSYHRFMREHLFDHVDIDPRRVHIPDGTVAADRVADYVAAYEEAIRDAGGLDLQLLGIGRTGHIGFNEPGSARDSRTRLIFLDRVTRRDAASDFFGLDLVPRRAITMGVGSILDARRVVLLAFGEHKADVVAQAVEGPVTAHIAASYLQQHPNATVVLDEAAAAGLTRFRSPWLLGPVAWTDALIRKAVVWLARKLDKPILKLTEEDYNEAGLQDLVAGRGPAYDINVDVFRSMAETITGWPGGKPQAMKRPGDIDRPADAVFPKRVLVFSPHPDDDVLSMGGTLIRLAEQGHEVHVAYQTSGNLAVFDADAVRFSEFALDFNRIFAISPDEAAKIERHVEDQLRRKRPGQIDSPEVRRIKTLIREGEARSAARVCGIPVERLHFLELPFYETGTVRKLPPGAADVARIVALLEEVKPQQVYAAGDLTDPHGTHRLCWQALREALARVSGKRWWKDAEVWLYRGAWQEWEPERMDMAVPLSPSEVVRKRDAIFKHQSQKDRAMFPGPDEREFWQRAEGRNREAARIYDRLGLAEYEAIEGFVRWRGAEG
jgi:glucosamine-6-phosphate deaminase